ncbi:MAG: T9SS type A sorting domain-containing protein [Saprospiraceae bacterium]|nr:T9SS type A sorting domain-containing protein [Saprospiraceae bacterium]
MNRLLLFTFVLLSQQLAAQPMSWTTACSDKNFCLNQNSCTQGQVFLVEKAVTNCSSPSINYSYRIDLNNDNTVDIQSSDDTVSGNFAKGIHKITWRATDNCGNLLQCTYLFHVKDCQPPSLLCINGLTQGLEAPTCSETFMASQFVLSMSDNCTPTDEIEIGIRRTGDGTGFPTQTSLSFGSCDEGFNQLEVWVRDGNGLTNLCNNYVLVQDSDQDCECNEDADVYINGCARSGGNKKIAQFRLKTKLETLPGAAVPLNETFTQIIEDSCYTVHLENMPFGDSYRATLSAEQKFGPLNGVTTYDLVLISKHILSSEPFTSVYQSVAADVNRSNSVTTFDILETRKLILGIYDTFPNAPAWRFVRPAANPSQVANFAALQDTYQIMLPNLLDDLTMHNYHFVGVKYGDVNGTASLNGEPSSDDRYHAPPLLLRTEDRYLRRGESTRVPLYLSEPALLDGWQWLLEADPSKLEILGIEGLSPEFYHLQGATLRVSWSEGQSRYFDAQQALVWVTVRSLQAGRLSDALALQAQHMRCEAYTERGRRPMALYFGEDTGAGVLFFSPKPNPFVSETSFEVLVQETSPAQLEIFDLNGRLVGSEQYTLDPGMQSLRLRAALLPTKGVYVYRLRVSDEVSSGRLVRME